jgi:hypothetical protein
MRFNTKDTLKKQVVISQDQSSPAPKSPDDIDIDSRLVRKKVVSQEEDIRLRYDEMMRKHLSVIDRCTKPITWTTTPIRKGCTYPMSALDVLTPSFEVKPPQTNAASSNEVTRTSCEVVTQQRLSTFCNNPYQIPASSKENQAQRIADTTPSPYHFKPVVLNKEPDQDYPIEFFIELEPEQRIGGLQLCECTDSEEKEDEDQIPINPERKDKCTSESNDVCHDTQDDLLPLFHGALRQALPDCLHPTDVHMFEGRQDHVTMKDHAEVIEETEVHQNTESECDCTTTTSSMSEEKSLRQCLPNLLTVKIDADEMEVKIVQQSMVCEDESECDCETTASSRSEEDIDRKLMGM